MLDARAELVGIPGSRHRLVTPALVLDIDVATANLHLMVSRLARSNLKLRANAKSHKCTALARHQVARGVIGVCCATVGEAAAMAAAGIPGILVTTPMTTPQKIAIVIGLVKAGSDLMLAVDYPSNVSALAAAAASAGVRLRVLIDVDAGAHRTGVASSEAAIALALQVSRSPGLEYAGLQCYAGQVQHLPSADARAQGNREALARLRALKDALVHEGLPPAIVSGGGTGTFDTDGSSGALTESQAGSFMFMDVEYLEVWEREGRTPPFTVSLYVQTAVHSASHEGMVTTDAGSKRFATDAGHVVVATPLPVATRYAFHGDEHGKVHFADGRNHLSIGDRIECVVPHCDPTINLYDRI